MTVTPVAPAGALRFAWAPRPGLLTHRFLPSVRSRQDFYKAPRFELNQHIPGSGRRTAAAQRLQLTDELNSRTMRRIGSSRRALFEAIERSALQSLPAEPFDYAEWKRCRAGLARQVLLWPQDQGLQLPVTHRNNTSSLYKVEWRPAAYHMVLMVRRHPVYAGAYVFAESSRLLNHGTALIYASHACKLTLRGAPH